MGDRKKMIQVGAGGFGSYWLETIIPRVADVAELVAAVDVNQEALKSAQLLTGLPAEKCYMDLKEAIAGNAADFINILDVKERRIKNILRELVDDGKLIDNGVTKGKRYKKANK